MSRPLHRNPASTGSSDLLGPKAEEALRLGKFKDAIELLKQLIKQDDRPQWRAALVEAYLGRAKALAAKGMVKEAVVVLGNTMAPDGTYADPLFLLHCLVRLGQFEKALAQGVDLIRASPAAVAAQPELAELTAALSLAFPVPLEMPRDPQSPGAKWIEAALAAREALAAWIERKPEDAIDPLLARISLRSPFKAVRLIVKALLGGANDLDRSRRLLEGVAAQSPFASFRRAVEAAMPGDATEVVAAWSGAGAAQQSFLAGMSAASPAAAETLLRLSEAERAGPAALFSYLTKQAARLPKAEARAACLNLLPRLPDHIGQFERAFGELPPFEANRVLALSAEARAQWGRAEKHWRAAAAAFLQADTREGKLSAGVIYRHLARLAEKEPAIDGDGSDTDPTVFYLESSLEADPHHLPTVLRLIDLCREADDDKRWHALIEEAVRRFPEDGAVLLQAIDSAAARKAYKKAAGFARKLLVLDPINLPVRQRMIELHIAQARKQLRAKRGDLAWKELVAAEAWERADAPDVALRLNKGLVGLKLDAGAEAEQRLRDAVALAGGSVVGWFRAGLAEVLMIPPNQPHMPIVRDELERGWTLQPTKPQIDAIIAALDAADVRAAARAAAGLLRSFSQWLLKAIDIPVPVAEAHALADVLLRAQIYVRLGEFAGAGLRRDPNEPVWRFYAIVARTQNNPDRLYEHEFETLSDMMRQTTDPKAFPLVSRIRQYLESSGDDPAALRRAKRLMVDEEADDDDMMDAMKILLADVSPEETRRLINKHGQDRAIRLIAERLGKSGIGVLMPASALEEVARSMVEMVLGEGRP